ncbi:MAG: hypothetical protein JXA42_14535 [Anaerolineales bacterium]|nr:hypothetical protein [Anaerolineales bacterium]
MAENNVTASAIMSFVEALEDRSSEFYTKLAEVWKEHESKWLAYAKESQKHKQAVLRTYRETISDALEACYSFEGLVLNDYAISDDMMDVGDVSSGYANALAIEEKAVEFYEKVADMSECLLATIPMAFRRVAKKRRRRIQEIGTLSVP